MNTEVTQIKNMLQDLDHTVNTRLADVESKLRTRKWASVPGVEDAGFSLFRAVKAIVSRSWDDAPIEREVFQETRRKALGTVDDSAGGYLVPAQAIPELIEQLRAETVVLQLGATLLSDLVGSPVVIPKQTSGASAYWVAENAEITSSEQTFAQLVMTPHKVAALVKLSAELIKLANPDAENIVRSDLGRQLSLAIDLAALRGTGADGQPTGIANTAGINTVSAAGPLTDLDVFSDQVYALEIDNALRGKLGFAFHPGVKRAIRRLRVPQWSGDTGGDYMLRLVAQALMSGDRALQEALGYPFACTTQIPVNLGGGAATEIYFANWQDLLIGQWAGITLMASGDAGDAFAKNQLWVRAVICCDIGIRHPESFCLVSDVTTA